MRRKVVSEMEGGVLDRQGRNELIDFLRGRAMIYVLLHHSGFPFGQYILAFHMPLFFIISGYIEYVRADKFKDDCWGGYIKKRFIRLMVPYFGFEIINYFIWVIGCCIRHKPIPTVDALLSIISCVSTEEYTGLCGRLWFLPCMFVTSILFRAILMKTRSKGSLFAVAIGALLLSWITTHILDFRIPFTIDTSMIALFFMVVSYLLGEFIHYCTEKGHLIFDIIISACCIFFLILTVNNGGQMLMSINSCGEFANSIFAAFSGSIAFIVISKYVYFLFCKFSILKKLILWYGKNSLAVFPIHLQIKSILILLITPYININYWYLMFFIMLFLSIPVVSILKKYLPFLTGDMIISSELHHI